MLDFLCLWDIYAILCTIVRYVIFLQTNLCDLLFDDYSHIKENATLVGALNRKHVLHVIYWSLQILGLHIGIVDVQNL